MIDTTITGTIEQALSHFATIGIAAILGRAGHRTRFWWSDDEVPAPILRSHLAMDEIGEEVRAHARRHAEAGSWAQQTVSQGARKGTGLLTVRAKAIPPEQWAAIHEERLLAVRHIDRDPLDALLVAALGEPAWWLLGTQGRSLDDGASRWEMKTRNRGEEFILNRLVPLAAAVAQRDVGQVVAGLRGDAILDETGQGDVSRTSTGLTTPGPTDSAVAWCALWGLHVMPTIARVRAVSQSAGMWPRRGVHPQVAMLPVFTAPVTVRRFAELCSDHHLDDLLRATAIALPSPELSARAVEASDWLRHQGVRAVAHFPILKTGSASAPERQLLAGELTVLPTHPGG